MQTSASLHTSFAEATKLLPTLKLLGNEEKLFLVQFLVAELFRKEKGFFLPEQVFPVWSPYDSYGAAEVMLHALKEHQSKKSAA